ncbi:replication-relaxation family protein [Brevibacillus halotolerans]|uniref:replication-relaxation family protein n=1 Tax=Brevibacillus TaxID=55080 RepID=UPI00215BD977|nr:MULTISPECIES: replication-relaxation family protein [Brevibacillus]MCR8964162.1 replication-relaxation family protein [Brevibacillus laterosporus]MCZ0836317.1 replication-relaxation family protein [Brevibacillus halotolerans]
MESTKSHHKGVQEKIKSKKKAYNQYNARITKLDRIIFSILYRHRMLTIELIHQLIKIHTSTYKLNSLRVRLNKLEVHGYLRGCYIDPVTASKPNKKYVSEKAYELTDDGVAIAVDELNLDYNLLSRDGFFEKNHYTASELRINKQIPHHFLTQRIAVQSILSIISSSGIEFFDIEYGYGEKFSLTWIDKAGKEKKVQPDWMFVNAINGTEQKHVIAVEADRSFMRAEQIERKYLGYSHYVQTLNNTIPLDLVVAVESEENKKIKRIRSLLHNALIIMENLLLEDLIRVFVLRSENAYSQISDIYLRREKEKGDVKNVLINLMRGVGYSLLRIVMDYELEEKYSFIPCAPDYNLRFVNENGKKVNLFVVHMQHGLLNDQVKLIQFYNLYTKNVKHMEEINIILGVYQDKEVLQEEVFVDLIKNEHVRFSLHDNVLLSSIDELDYGHTYKLEINDKNTQRLKGVSLFSELS